MTLLISALIDLRVIYCDIGNAYLNVPCKQKIVFVASTEFDDYQGMVMLLVIALYVFNYDDDDYVFRNPDLEDMPKL